MGRTTERLIIPISTEDKKLMLAKAARLGKISMAELARRAVLAYEPDDLSVEAELKALIDALPIVHAETLAQLDRTDLALDRCLSQLENSIRS